MHSIDIDEDKTIYEEDAKGFFRFGDVKLTSEEFGIVQREVSKSFESKMNNPDIYNQALISTQNALTDLIKKITSATCIIEVTFKE